MPKYATRNNLNRVSCIWCGIRLGLRRGLDYAQGNMPRDTSYTKMNRSTLHAFVLMPDFPREHLTSNKNQKHKRNRNKHQKQHRTPLIADPNLRWLCIKDLLGEGNIEFGLWGKGLGLHFLEANYWFIKPRRSVQIFLSILQ